MTPHARIRRIGWLAALSICLALYTMLHLAVDGLNAKVELSERQIAYVERENTLLETEFLARSSPLQLAALNRVEFGYRAPQAEQFIVSQRQLARFSGPRAVNSPNPIQLAGMTGEDAPPFPKLVSPLTGKPVDTAVFSGEEPEGGRLTVGLAQRSLRVPIAAVAGDLSR